MRIINHNKGRLGNSIFRMLANIVFLIVYDIKGQILNKYSKYDMVVSDEFFNSWSENILNGKIVNINPNLTYYFDGYYQHDKIYTFFKPQILEYLHNHKDLLLFTDRNEMYKAYDLVSYKVDKIYNIVVHLRLEDFLEINQSIDPLSITKIVDNLLIDNNVNDICFVVNNPKKEIEFKYIDFLKKNYDVVIESNTPIKDYTIMRNAKILICSYSTLSWCSAFFSDVCEKVYMPDYITCLHQTCKKPSINTQLYEFNFISIDKLNKLLN